MNREGQKILTKKMINSLQSAIKKINNLKVEESCAKVSLVVTLGNRSRKIKSLYLRGATARNITSGMSFENPSSELNFRGRLNTSRNPTNH